MLITRIGFLWAGIASGCAVGGCCGHSLAQPRPAHQLKLPFCTNEPEIGIDCWIGFSPDGRHLAAHYTLGDQSYGAVWETTRMRLVDSFATGGATSNQAYGPVCAFRASGSHFIYIADKTVCCRPLDKWRQPHSTRLRDRRALQSDTLSESLWVNHGDEGLKYLIVRNKEEVFIDDSNRSCPVKITDSSRHAVRDASCLALSADLSQMAWAEGHDRFAWGKVHDGSGQVTTIHLVSLEDGVSRKLTTTKPAAEMSSLAFSNDGRFLASGSYDGLLRIWELRTGREMATVFGASYTISTIAFSPDQSIVAFGSYDSRGTPNVRVVSIPDGRLMLAWSAFNDAGVLCVCFDHMGKRLAVLGGSQTINVYDVTVAPP